MFTDRTAVYLCILAYILTGNNLNAQYIYVVMAFYDILKQPMTMSFPMGVSSISELTITFQRLKKFLLLDEINYDNHDYAVESNTCMETIQKQDIAVALKQVSAKWSPDSPEDSLCSINMKFSTQQLSAIIGPVGCGKSTLLHAILGELPVSEGNLVINGTVSYASQEPWLFTGSIKDNILFGSPLRQNKYDQVVKVCALERDLATFPYADETLVGEKALTLSGGQKARINLARAVYKEADIYMLDDVLSAVDTQVGKHIFTECINGYLKNKCRIFITHQLQFLKSVDEIFLLENGKIIAKGNYESLRSSGIDYTKKLKEQLEETKTNDKSGYEQSFDQSKKEVQLPAANKEFQVSGTVSKSVYKRYFKAGGSVCSLVVLSNLFIFTQFFASCCDFFLSYW